MGNHPLPSDPYTKPIPYHPYPCRNVINALTLQLSPLLPTIIGSRYSPRYRPKRMALCFQIMLSRFHTQPIQICNVLIVEGRGWRVAGLLELLCAEGHVPAFSNVRFRGLISICQPGNEGVALQSFAANYVWNVLDKQGERTMQQGTGCSGQKDIRCCCWVLRLLLLLLLMVMVMLRGDGAGAGLIRKCRSQARSSGRRW